MNPCNEIVEKIDKERGREISRLVNALQRERHEKMRTLIDEWDKEYYYPKLQLLRKMCNHKMEWRHNGPLGDPWFYCIYCGYAECRHDE